MVLDVPRSPKHSNLLRMAKRVTKSEAKELRSDKIQYFFDGKRAPRALAVPKRLLRGHPRGSKEAPKVPESHRPGKERANFWGLRCAKYL